MGMLATVSGVLSVWAIYKKGEIILKTSAHVLVEGLREIRDFAVRDN